MFVFPVGGERCTLRNKEKECGWRQVVRTPSEVDQVLQSCHSSLEGETLILY